MLLHETDIRRPERVQNELARASRELGASPEVSDRIRTFVGRIASDLRDLPDDEISSVDPYLVVALQRAALGALLALDEGDPAAERKGLRYRLEQMRHVFRDLAAEQAVGEDRPSKDVARDLAASVDVPQRELAALLGVGERTFQRWVSTHEPTAPEGDDARRIRVVARIVQQLRHSFTGVGVIRWFERPRQDIGGARPIDLIDNPDAVGQLLSLAAGARSSGAT